MLSDGVARRQHEDEALDTVEVTDVAEVLLRSVRSTLTEAPSPRSATPSEGNPS
jgi:hypothetical protein